jgi:hypothetical protein
MGFLAKERSGGDEYTFSDFSLAKGPTSRPFSPVPPAYAKPERKLTIP